VRGKKERIALYAPFGRKNSRKRKFYSDVSFVLFPVVHPTIASRLGVAYEELAEAKTEEQREAAQRKVQWLNFCQACLDTSWESDFDPEED
jgi:hypothetical protein